MKLGSFRNFDFFCGKTEIREQQRREGAKMALERPYRARWDEGDCGPRAHTRVMPSATMAQAFNLQ